MEKVEVKLKLNSEEIYKIIGQNIKKIRKTKGYTGEKLANLCHLSYGYIKNLESEKVHATISIETLYLISGVLKVELSDLIEGI